VVQLGRTLLQDLYASTPLASSILPPSSIAESVYAYSIVKAANHPSILLPPPTNEEIAGYFSLINDLKYSQPHQPLPAPSLPPLEGLTITAYGAGHTLGGTLWHIQHGSESVVYAVDWNQARENVFPGAAWLGGSGTAGTQVIEQLSRPTALICSSKGSENVALAGGWKKRDEILLNHIRSTIHEGGNVLLPCDTSARVLEMTYMLERAWLSEKSSDSPTSLRNAKLYLASRTCGSTMRYTRTLLEWMDESLVRELEAENSSVGRQSHGRRPNEKNEQNQPFDFKYCKLLERQSQVTRALATPGSKIFLASDRSMEWGFSRDLIRHMSAESRNMIILTDGILSNDKAIEQSSGSLLETMWSLLEVKKNSDDPDTASVAVVHCPDITIQIKEPQTSALGGSELSLYQQYLANQRQRQNTLSTDKSSNLEISADVVDDNSSSTSSSSDESDTEQQGKALNVSSTLTHSKHKLGLTDEELGVNILLRRKDIHDYDVRGKKGREKIFPFVAKRRRVDDFGDLIRPEEYLRAEERDDIDGQDMRGPLAKGDSTLGQKRKWGDQDAGKADPRRRMSDGFNGRRKSQRNDLTKGEDPVINGVGDQPDADDESEESDYEPAEPTVRGPTKVIFTSENLTLKFKIAAVDFSGIHDKRALQMLIPLIRPRKLILTGGNEEETLSLALDCRKMLGSNSSTASGSNAAVVLTPTIGMSIDASVDTNAWTIKLSQSLYKHLRWQSFQNSNGLGIATIYGRLETPGQDGDFTYGNIKKRQRVLDDEGKDLNNKPEAGQILDGATPMLSELPASLAGTTRSVNQSLHVGDLKLPELRTFMQSTGHTAEFKGEGTLLVDGLIAVRKNGIGKIEVESGGPMIPRAGAREPGGSFFSVKKKIYEGLAVVAAR